MFYRRFASHLLHRPLGAAVMLASLIATVFVVPALAADPASGQDTILHAAETSKILPPSIFYRGQTATVQSRNSGGVRFADGLMLLATNVDSSGYSSGIKQKFQSYLLTEVPLEIAGKHLPAGAYGLGFMSGQIVVTDIGAHDVLQTKSSTDANLRRPMPLQVLADTDAHHFRIYAGREYFVISRTEK